MHSRTSGRDEGTRGERRELRASQKPQEDSSRPDIAPMSLAIESTVEEARRHAAQAKRLVSSGKIADASRELEQAVARVEKIAGASKEIVDENAMVRVLASVGTQLASFIHEINGLVDIARGVDQALKRIRDTVGLTAAHRKALGELQRSIGDLRRMLERQASYLIDVVSPDARRRRSRQNLAARFDSACRLVAFAAEKRNIRIVNQLGPDLKSPPMFPAELTAVFSNLLTNAIKAAGKKGRIRVSARQARDEIVLRMENTGKAVRLREAERWFQPFESSTANVDPALGQGMGLGLPITRSMLEEYGATIRFAPPSAGFATAVEITFPT
jgi:signal transduction histidine kinase